MTIISPDGSQVKLQGVRQGFNISRQIFDENLLNMATNSGAKLIREKVTEIKRRKRFWEVRTNKQSLSTRILVGADGVNSLVRRKTIGSIPREELGIAYGYIATGVENEPTTMKFLKDHLGYIWITPRGSHSCVGVCSEIKNGSKLKKILDDFVAFHCPSIKIASRFAAMFPFAKSPGFFDLPCAGNDWILVGDAAGHADPVTGEGIIYALWSGKLAAETIRRNELGLYDGLWKKEYGGYLLKRAADKDTFYNPLTIELSMMLRSALGKR
jgi:flavin-dependent dehydrogenase